MQFFILIFHPFDSQTGRSHSPHSRGSLAAASSWRPPRNVEGLLAGTPAKHPPPAGPPPALACGGRRAGGGGRGGALHLVREVVPLLPGLRRGAWAGSPGRRGDPKWQKKGGTRLKHIRTISVSKVWGFGGPKNAPQITVRSEPPGPNMSGTTFTRGPPQGDDSVPLERHRPDKHHITGTGEERMRWRFAIVVKLSFFELCCPGQML